MKKIILCLVLLLSTCLQASAWGFFGHQRINRLAVFTLPSDMVVFYKFYIGYITENSVNPDKRRYAVKDEAPRHYLDADIYNKFYNDSAVFKMPRYWNEAVARFSEDTLMAYGIVPWHIYKMKMQLTEAFKSRDVPRILRLSAEIGHYIGDANVPLHTTENYNGQLTGQTGIHGFWESRLPELYADEYELWTGTAQYLKNPQLTAWEAVTNAHMALDSVLRFERELTKMFPEDKKFVYEQRNRMNMRTYSLEFSKAYHDKLAGQVERRMRAAIKMVGDFWFTCWVDAGKPDLRTLLDKKNEEDPMLKPELDNPNTTPLKVRPEGDSGNATPISPRELRAMLFERRRASYKN
jgi:hypothetical protein